MTRREPAQSLAIGGAEPATDALAHAPEDAALAEFVAAHYDRLVRLARLVCRDGTDAGDAVQVALERAWRQRLSLRDANRLRPWLDRIVVREAIRVSRSRQSWFRRAFGLDAGVSWIEPRDSSAEQLVDWSAFTAAFSRLSTEQRAVIALHLYVGYSIVETADLVGAPIETVRSRLRVAKDRLRRDLEGSET